ncbi:glycosyltransferase [Virgibacillus sp. MSP4-1]|uniref:glycosyltransferase n=1 Tax=Virgibacillus sp. MSP4-1 TaxID=2700081 RepID=UPI001EE3FE7D|nr:glycosyltransferase [Virgibacillus sp. MSP4-1]
MVFDVPAESGGALTILNQYYQNAINDKDNEWIFVVSTPELQDTKDVKVLKYPWVKKSWFHRLYFDNFVAPKLVRKYLTDTDEVISLQNTIIPKVKSFQTLYVHQPLPFVDIKFGMRENLKFWIYQNIISNIIFRSIRKADRVIVQTKWMKESCLKKTKVTQGKIDIQEPKVNIEVKKKYKDTNLNKKIFFYPASGQSYKNHKVIVKATKALIEKGINNFEVYFTISKDDNKETRDIFALVMKYNLPIYFLGKIKLEEVYNYYSKSILIFPSYIETFGLPLLEAKLHQTRILASDCEFSHEILDGYDKVAFFNPMSSENLSQCMKQVINT